MIGPHLSYALEVHLMSTKHLWVFPKEVLPKVVPKGCPNLFELSEGQRIEKHIEHLTQSTSGVVEVVSRMSSLLRTHVAPAAQRVSRSFCYGEAHMSAFCTTTGPGLREPIFSGGLADALDVSGHLLCDTIRCKLKNNEHVASGQDLRMSWVITWAEGFLWREPGAQMPSFEEIRLLGKRDVLRSYVPLVRRHCRYASSAQSS